jgi:2-dehydro-3-deoxyphosphogluconate aldolase/(4S)-4-hydroxy-2-oxoglutarate aldolase
MFLPAFRSRVVPVVSFESVDDALPVAEALLRGGIDVIEITLRRPGGLPAIARLRRELPEICVGAGTLLTADDLHRARDAGAAFGLSPGASEALLETAAEQHWLFVPGVMTPSEAMRAREHGFKLQKLFPAEQAGGIRMLRALRGPLADLQFCPTGGIGPDQLPAYLAEPNVRLVGGSWIAPAALISAGDWSGIERLAREATAIGASLTG